MSEITEGAALCYTYITYNYYMNQIVHACKGVWVTVV